MYHVRIMFSLHRVAKLPYVDLDSCQFSTWGYQKPMRFWGGTHVKEVEPRVCNSATCPNIQLMDGQRVNRERLGGNNVHLIWEKKSYASPRGDRPLPFRDG